MAAHANERDDVLSALPVPEGDYTTQKCDVNGATWVHDVNSTEINASLNAIEASVASIDTDFNVALSTRATEATLSAFKTENDANLDLANASLDVIEAIETGANVKFAVVNAVAAGDSTVVAAVVGKKIRVLGWALTTDSSGNQTWKSGATPIAGPMRFHRDAGGVTYSGTPSAPAFETAVGAALVLTATANTGGHVTYLLI